MILKDKMKTARLILLILIVSHQLYSQKVRELGMTPVWSHGKVILKNNKIYEGEIYYNTHFGTVQFKRVDESEIISVQENNVQSITYFDKILNRTRNYYTFPVRDTLTDKNYELLFEIVKDFKTSAVLSRMTRASIFFPINYSSSRNILHDFGVPPDRMYVQIEGIFFVDNREKVELYSLIMDMDYDGLLYDYSKSKSKIIKDKLLKNFAGPHWEEISKYIKQNKLKPKFKPDLIRILDQYEYLIFANNDD